MKILVVSGGGSHAAYSLGKMQKKNIDYDVAIGCSTGALIAPLAILGQWNRLKEAYTTVTTDTIFEINPFDQEGNIKIFPAVVRLLKGNINIGEHHNLRKLISEFFTEADYKMIKALNKDVIVTVCNISDKTRITEYVSVYDCDYETFCDYMWASAAVPFVTSKVRINGDLYVDGGLTCPVPLLHVLAQEGWNPEHIDCYVHRPQEIEGKRKPVQNPFHYLFRLFKVGREQMLTNDLIMGTRICKAQGIPISISYLPYELETNALVFDPKKMLKWYDLGKNSPE